VSFGPDPWQQRHWDWRAAGNFICGGAGSGLIVCAALSAAPVGWLLAGAALVGVGLSSVWLEIGRPWRALHVYLNPRTSWMTREAMVALALFTAVAAAWLGVPLAGAAAPLLALGFVFCQGRMLRAAKGIPAWREPRIVPLIVATGLAEGAGLLLLSMAFTRMASAPQWLLFALALLARWLLWAPWRQRIGAAPRALAALDHAGVVFKTGTWVALVLGALAIGVPLPEVAARALQLLGGVLAVASGAWFKFTLLTRGAFNQGFALAHLPVRGVRR
jgi:phenylacetyl-CoA:acceptor oxidoreductase 26-kDa subunit